MRLRSYDYNQPGYYFVTFCTKNRAEILGVVENGEMKESAAGKIVRKCWFDLPDHYLCELDAFVVMPDHVHGIIIIPPNPVGAGLKPAPTGVESLLEIVRALKTFSSRQINILQNTVGRPVWQRSFYDHVIRNEHDLNAIREYITYNPAQWEVDRKERKMYTALHSP